MISPSLSFCKLAALAILILFHIAATAQDSSTDSAYAALGNAAEDTSKVNSLLQLSQKLFGTDPGRAIRISEEAYTLADRLKFSSGMAFALKNVGIGYYVQSNYAAALVQWQQASAIFEAIGNEAGVANMLTNIGAVYFSQSEYSESIDFYLRALKIAEKIRDSTRIATALANIGAAHSRKDQFDLAVEAYLKALPIFEQLGDQDGIGLTHVNLGDEYYSIGEYAKAIHHHGQSLQFLEGSPYRPSAIRGLGGDYISLQELQKGMHYLDSALILSEELGNMTEVKRILNFIAGLREEQGDDAEAIRLYQKSLSIHETDPGFREQSAESLEGLVGLYARRGEFRKAFKHQEQLITVRDSINNAAANERFNRLLFNFEIDKKESEIDLLRKDGELQGAVIGRQKTLRNAFIGGFLLMVCFAIVFLLQRNRISRERKRSDNLLLNILPEEVAEDLKIKGTSDAQHIDQATVLFSDFQSFTSISEKLTPKELVEDLHACFSRFDEIMDKYGVEKIKTIGDAYMAAGGVPVADSKAVLNTVKAGLEMGVFMEQNNASRMQDGKMPYEMRIGIHTGPVVAGIVGIKKFQYDIWGDTVNTAARMESHGEVGRVNISETTYQNMKDFPEFRFIPRGKVQAKGKGEMEMYFVVRA